jgi:hypothetical protein
MRSLLAVGLAAALVAGCATGPSDTASFGPLVPVVYDNPSLVPIADHQVVWDNVSEIIAEYFRIEREEPVRLIGNTLTEGRIDSFPEVSPTILEPWRPDTVGTSQRMENTLQSMRRRAIVRVVPTSGGYWVDVSVLKELEDVQRPEHATAGAATLRFDNTLTRVVNPVGPQAAAKGWILQGRDAPLEQRIIAHLQSRFGDLGARPAPPMQTVPPGGPLVPIPSPSPCSTTSYKIALPAEPELPPPAPYESSGLCEGLGAGTGIEISRFPAIREYLCDTCLDYQYFYSLRGLALLGAGLGTAAILANTNLDQEFQDWYQNDVRSTGTDNFASIAKQFGEGMYAIPVFAGLTVLRPYLYADPAGAVVGDWGDRCLRTVVVGGPPVLALQWILGASRPSAGSGSSHWRPFNDTHGVSGHAFIGAIGFVNAANMCDNLGFKLVMYGLSVLPAWSRINDNDHYLSQSLLGWWLAYLGASAVNNTEQAKQAYAVVPLAMADGVGVGVTYRF